MSESALPIVLISEAESSGKCYRPAPLNVLFLRKNVRSIRLDEETIEMLVHMMSAMEMSTSTDTPVCRNQRSVATPDCGSCCR
jgi:nitric oxide synthase oxygenase domain/subunit